MRWMKKKKEKNLTILLLGLDNAGKSTLLFGLKDQLPDTVTPTIGFRPSTVVKGKYTIQWFDVGGAKNFRRVWQSYYSEVHGVIYVVDAADRERFEESKETLAMTLESEGIVGKPVLIFANKQDMDGCASPADLTKEMGLLERRDCRHQVAACSAKPPEGQPVDARIAKALTWLLESIDSDYTKLNDRVVSEKAEHDKKENERRAAQKKRAEESKALRLKEQAEAEAEVLKKADEDKGAAAAGVTDAGSAHASSDQTKNASNEAWSGENKDAGAEASVRAPAEVGSTTPRDSVEKMDDNSTPVRNGASLPIAHETPGKDEAPPPASEEATPKPVGRLPALEVGDSLAGGGSPVPSSSGKPRLGKLKPMPPPVTQPEPTLPNAMPSPVPGGASTL